MYGNRPRIPHDEGRKARPSQVSAGNSPFPRQTLPEKFDFMRIATVTQLLIDHQAGDRNAADRLLSLLYHELRQIAGGCMRRERPGHTLQPTALVHEAYMRLLSDPDIEWESRGHFLGIAARAMRQILVNHAEKRNAQKRGGDWQRVHLDDLVDEYEQRAIDLVALNDALDHLAGIDDTQSRIVELRFFGGLSIEETAEALSLSPRTISREWQMARAWLRRRLDDRG